MFKRVPVTMFRVLALFVCVLSFFCFTSTSFAATKDSSIPRGVACNQGWYLVGSGRTTGYINITPVESLQNGTSSTETLHLSVTKSVTVSATISDSLKLSAGFLVAGAEDTFGVSLSLSATVTSQVDITAPVPPHSTVYGQYRVYVFSLTYLDYEYKLTDCAVTSSGTAYLYNLTYQESWVTWS